MDKRYFPDKIVKWYESNKRSLPWRDTRDPYKIWLSEIILQQTRVSQGLPYYLRFIEAYPTVRALAAAPEQEVLRLWQGLGYYTRARNLHKCAKAVVSLHNGEFPRTYETLLSLPGIGEYTAAAIASIAFKQAVAVVDGNVFRVLSRIFGIDTPINSPEGKKQFTALANELVPTAQPDAHNQAVMEFGALFCTPQNPQCDTCIFQKNCFAFSRKMQQALPVKLKLKASRKRYFYYIVLEHRNSLLMRKREQKDIWLGLFDFHLVEKNRPVKPEKILEEEAVKKMVGNDASITISKNYKHILTHQTIFSRFIIVKSDKKIKHVHQNHSFYSLPQIAALPKPVLVSRFLQEHYVL
ncbi:A/G-specific adenine glycosylase [Fulvivirgaceae bacterium PWU4]|uniref:Adenine DNA glycosylase n=2 Tax=Chryseosolibacter histidini TaxID=2782349 RepID=A0AAP2GRE8_9BACT|nr:A/G-specific adenine glycosylase [Chryseosolibacter histidini]